jgi:dienelactone hydrolase
VFEYFPGNYVWNLAVIATLANGGELAEIDEACRPIRDAAAQGSDAGTQQFFDSWSAVADRLIGLAERDEAAGRAFSAGEKYRRAALYLINADRMQSVHAPDRRAHYERAIALQHKAMRLARDPVEVLEIPYAGASLPAYLYRAPAADGAPAPCLVVWNGFDSFKEQLLGAGLAQQLARRGISTLLVDQPGTGGALRLHGLHAVPETEAYGTACYEYLAGRDDVDPARIGILGVSLGGYYAPRAAAFEQRFALVVSWGANHDWGEVQRRRLQREGENPVPHYWEHALWVWGQTSMEDFEKLWDRINLDGVVERIRVPYLVVHGGSDRQIPVEYAHRSYEQAVNSSKRELKVYTAEEGGVEHCNLDDPSTPTSFIADWVAETFGQPVG